MAPFPGVEEGSPEPGTGPDKPNPSVAGKGVEQGGQAGFREGIAKLYAACGEDSGGAQPALNFGMESELPGWCAGWPARGFGQPTVENLNNN